MKRIIAISLACVMAVTGCGTAANDKKVDSNADSTAVSVEDTDNSTTSISNKDSEESNEAEVTYPEIDSEANLNDEEAEQERRVEAAENYQSLNDPELLRYVQDTVYTDLVKDLDSSEYFVENVEAIYISKEYIEELEYNSKENIFFGYTLSELDEQFQGTRYVFTLREDGTTTVVPFENYDDTYDQVLKNVAIGTGVILVCVTVSVATGGAAPAVSMIFAASAKTGTAFALSSGVISGVSSAVVTGIQTKDFDAAVKAGAKSGSEAFKWGAISGALAGGAGEAVALHGATLNGLSMNEAALIQKESGYPLDVIKQFSSMDQYQICKDAGLTSRMVSGKTALVRNIDLNQIDELGRTNLQRMIEGLAPLDPTGIPYELHHVGQKADSTLAILTRAEHRLGENHKIWHVFGEASEIDRVAFDKQRAEFWLQMAKILGGAL